VEISRRLHEDPDLKDTPVIVVSGVKQALDMPIKVEPDDAYMPVKAFLEKPFKPDQLLSTINEVLGSAEAD
jgi:CheY-like chemotaxis protein